MSIEALALAVHSVVTELGDVHIGALAAAYRDEPSSAPAHSVVPAVHFRAVDRLHAAWLLCPDVPGSAIALALETARVSAASGDAPRVEVVVTGPDSPAVPIRLTSEVVVGLIASAQSRVTVVSYSVAVVPPVLDALRAAATRGVRVNLIFESPEHFGGASGASGAGPHAYGDFPIYHWPPEERPPNALLHAKAVIVDGRDILVTSANLSNLAHQTSLELGLLCRGGGVAERVQRHFDALISTGHLRRASQPVR